MSLQDSKTVVVGMSGGVDSSVAALLLKQQGYRVIGMFMKNWEELDEDGQCQSNSEYEDVVRVCDMLEIPHYSVNFVKEYWDGVFEHFLKEYKAGHTPNPDILCNREIKFKALYEKAKEYGADYLATGHYVRRGVTDEGESLLLKGLDPGKDQSYFLYAINGKVLDDVLFPVGELQKSEVRKIAAEYGLATAQKKDSTGICFIGKRNFKNFLGQYLKKQPGNFETLEGKVVGQHDGVAYYTIGQRRGTAIGGPGEAWFVVGKDVARNVVYVEQGADHPSLFDDCLTATESSWISPKGPPKMPFKCKAKIRYRQDDQECTITQIEGDRLLVEFSEPQRAIAQRQSVVFYQGDICLGGAIIESRGLA
ncbi:MAG: tRNA 2-thiouridine(34) synthase MnmA [Chlamydiota bacterium]|nr:tRNA 2-thiouridine(34) synthase MnmA [Chlamydiota bacterium]